MGERGRKDRTGILSRSFLRYRASSVFLVFAVLFVLFTLLSPEHHFVRRDNLNILLAEGSEFCIVVLAVGLLMICGEFDLSVGSILVFCSFVFIRLFQGGMNLFLAWAIVLVTGGLIGLVNGLVTVKGHIPSFITTLGTMMFWRGITLLWSEGFTASFDQASSPRFVGFLTGTVGGYLPVQAVWFAAIAVVLGLLLHSHKFGNRVFATGGNPAAARAMGIRTDRIKSLCFAIVGAVCAFVGVMQVVRVSSFFSRAGDGWELKAIAASVVGATALMGGRGSMPGILLYMVFGFVIIVSVVLRGSLERSRLRH
jgi:simple sugar transport system permease protein